MNKILFLCSRNICSSRVAEALFNHIASQQSASQETAPNGLRGWKAESRGLEIDPFPGYSISPNAIDYLESQGISVPCPRSPLPVEPSDLLWADLVVALHEGDHRPIIESRYSLWANRVEFWNVPDFHESNWGRALPKLEANVLELISVIRSGCYLTTVESIV